MDKPEYISNKKTLVTASLYLEAVLISVGVALLTPPAKRKG